MPYLEHEFDSCICTLVFDEHSPFVCMLHFRVLGVEFHASNAENLSLSYIQMCTHTHQILSMNQGYSVL